MITCQNGNPILINYPALTSFHDRSCLMNQSPLCCSQISIRLEELNKLQCTKIVCKIYQVEKLPQLCMRFVYLHICFIKLQQCAF